MIHGHTHKISINRTDSDFDSYRIQPCTAVVASQLDGNNFAGCGFTFCNNAINVIAVSDKGEFLTKEIIKEQ